MIKKIIISLLFILSSAQLWADCGDIPDLDSTEKGVSVYSYAHTIIKEIVYDNLIVWKKDSKELCFSITTISTKDNRECSLDGKATKVRKNQYTYTQNECRISLIFIKNKVKVNVTGSRGTNFCSGEDLGKDNGGCGMNTSINSAIYKVRNK